MVKLQRAKSFAGFLRWHCGLQLLCLFNQLKKISLLKGLITFKLFGYRFPLSNFLKFSSPIILNDLSVKPVYR